MQPRSKAMLLHAARPLIYATLALLLPIVGALSMPIVMGVVYTDQQTWLWMISAIWAVFAFAAAIGYLNGLGALRLLGSFAVGLAIALSGQFMEFTQSVAFLYVAVIFAVSMMYAYDGVWNFKSLLMAGRDGFSLAGHPKPSPIAKS